MSLQTDVKYSNRVRPVDQQRKRLEDIILDNMIEDIEGVETYLINLTPAVAEEFLSRNTKNRPIADRWVDKLALIMERDEWEMNGETVVISASGRLIQGQHRCKAVVKSGVTIQVLLVVGIPDAAFKTFDRVRGRTVGDALAIKDYSNYNITAAVAKLVIVHSLCGEPFRTDNEHYPTPTQIMDFLEHNKDVNDVANYIGGSPWIKRYVTSSIGGFCKVVFDRFNKHKSEEFFHALETGVGLEVGSPILALRDRLTEDYTSKAKLVKRYKCALVFKAFKAFLRGKTLKTSGLRVKTEGERAETDLFVL